MLPRIPSPAHAELEWETSRAYDIDIGEKANILQRDCLVLFAFCAALLLFPFFSPLTNRGSRIGGLEHSGGEKRLVISLLFLHGLHACSIIAEIPGLCGSVKESKNQTQNFSRMSLVVVRICLS
ncbi:hypothetical protein RRF57_000772 [Xylaria bambusicola]|uniref:Uncharacterized protein n=1 Tax=Xylaria bambusicola TaxID=326684 RepID=A0AAN7Z5S3_9PEZI